MEIAFSMPGDVTTPQTALTAATRSTVVSDMNIFTLTLLTENLVRDKNVFFKMRKGFQMLLRFPTSFLKAPY